MDVLLSSFFHTTPRLVKMKNELHIPSSVTRIGDSAVSALSVAEPQPNTFLISVATTGVHTLVFEYQNFVQGRVVPLLKTNLKPSYNPSLRMFVLAPSGDSISYSFAKVLTKLVIHC